jgi:hypothetical protein
VGRDQLAHGAEVALALGAGVGHVPENGSPARAEGGTGRGHREEGVPRGEQSDQYPEQQAGPHAAQGARAGGAAPGEPARHPFHEPQAGADNVELLDREAVVGEPVDRPLGGFVVVEARDGVPRGTDRI